MDHIDVKNLSVCINDYVILRSVSFVVNKGQCVGLIGKNGAGKTTLLRAMQGLSRYSGVSNIAALSYEDRARLVAWVPQIHDIVWDVKVKKLLEFTALKFCRNAEHAEQTISTSLASTNTVQLAEKNLSTLSSGELALVNVARALCQNSDFILMDEPLANLDPRQKSTLILLMKTLTNQNKGIMFTSHDMPAVEAACDRIIALKHGALLFDETHRITFTDRRNQEIFD